MEKSNIKVVLLIFLLAIISTVIVWRFFQIPVKPEIPSSVLKECKPQKIVVPAKENNRRINITVEIKGKTNGFCEVKYVSPGGSIEILNEVLYIYNEKGNLCAFKTFDTSMEIGKFLCNFISLSSIT